MKDNGYLYCLTWMHKVFQSPTSTSSKINILDECCELQSTMIACLFFHMDFSFHYNNVSMWRQHINEKYTFTNY
jgi:hypothetical protein